MKVLIAAGGTGGHIYPAISVGERLRERSVEVIFLGTKEGMEKYIVPKYGFELITISSGQFVGKNLSTKLKTSTKILKGIIECIQIIREEKPICVLGMGSFVSFPAVLSAVLLNVPSFLHEQNLILGLTNRILHRFAKKIFLSFEETAKIHRIENYSYTGNPIRKSIKARLPSNGKKGFGLFVFGGSRGAKSINKAICELLPFVSQLKELRIYHQTGYEEYERVKIAYQRFNIKGEVFPFTEDMAKYYSISDLVISRAGSSTIFELAFMKKPAILIPYPYSAGKHQWKNALYVEKIGGAYLVPDNELSGKILYSKLEGLMKNENLLKEMGENMGKLYVEDADERIANEIMGYI
ncbi:MAG: undecaprenyldiphospho-muramoylpentapeptide beta-N-acetylglucosaminyltransferase [Deltaproteobacteria bacterium]|nr:undecaprenyldiphospho-muramoylpentapeptide beta-N-acetylglucosaminyltransferase [Deltaproteobacteria bacterium]